MIVERYHEIVSSKQSKWLEKIIKFNSQKNKAKKEFEKDFYKLLNKPFCGKTMENARNPLGLNLFRKDDTKNVIKQQSNITFIRIHRSYGNCDSYLFRNNEVLIHKPIFLGFTVIELSKLHKYETSYDKLQTNFGQDKSHFTGQDKSQYMDSVTKDNPILLKENETFKYLKIDEIVDE